MTDVTNLPPEWDVTAKQGDIFGWFYVDWGTVDITGYTFAGHVRKSADDALPTAELTFEIIDSHNMRWCIEATETAKCTCHPTDIDDPSSAYIADVQVTPGDAAEAYTMLEMNIKIKYQATKP